MPFNADGTWTPAGKLSSNDTGTNNAPTTAKTNYPAPSAWSTPPPTGPVQYTTNQGPNPPATQPQTGQKSVTTDPAATWSKTTTGAPMPAGINPDLAALYNQYGDTPTGQGTGLTDWQYWQNVENSAGPGYTLGRLGSDLAGNGPDVGGGGRASNSGSGAGGGAYVPGAGVPGMGSIFGGGTIPNSNVNALENFMMGIGTGKTSDTSLPGLQVNPNDPTIKGSVDAYRSEQQNQLNNYLSNLAEQMGPNTNIGAQRAMGAETMAQNTAGFQANLMAQELASRRQELQQMLSGATGFLTQEQQMQLQEELNQLSLAEQAFQYDTTSQYNNSPMAG